MSFKIGIVGPARVIDYLKNIEIHVKNECELTYFTYHSLIEITDICLNNQFTVDAYIFSGELPYRSFKNNCPEFKKPCYSLSLTREDLYKTLLKLSAETGNVDFSRTLMDFISPDNDFMGLKDILPNDRFPYYVNSSSLDDEVYTITKELNTKLWMEGKIDLSITRLGSIEDWLISQNYKVLYIAPTVESFRATLEKAINNTKVFSLENSQVAIGNISIYNKSNSLIGNDTELELKKISIYKALIDYSQKFNIPYTIQRNDLSFEIFISKGLLRELTDDFLKCSLLNYLIDSLSFRVNIGWGIGKTVKDARQNAQYANIESGKRGGNTSFVITEDEQVIGPLSMENCFAYTNTNLSQIEEICKKTKLSALNIQKILSIMEKMNTNELSSSDIAYYLGITERSANRILAKLEAANYALPKYNKSEKLRGRPKIIYSISINP